MLQEILEYQGLADTSSPVSSRKPSAKQEFLRSKGRPSEWQSTKNENELREMSASIESAVSLFETMQLGLLDF